MDGPEKRWNGTAFVGLFEQCVEGIESRPNGPTDGVWSWSRYGAETVPVPQPPNPSGAPIRRRLGHQSTNAANRTTATVCCDFVLQFAGCLWHSCGQEVSFGNDAPPEWHAFRNRYECASGVACVSEWHAFFAAWFASGTGGLP